MLFQILLAIVFGVVSGIITGLTPGIHINLISVLVVTYALPLSPIALGCFIVSMSVVHSFLDSIPSIYLGAPDSAQALGVLPGHRYLLAGHGYTAVKLTVIGSLGALILSVFLFPFFVPVVKYGYGFIASQIGWILLVVITFMTLRNDKFFWALTVLILSGVLGYIVLNGNFENPLFPMLSGLFGVSTLIYSIKENSAMPKQVVDSKTKIPKKLLFKSLISGQLSGFLTAVLPGVGASTAAIISLQFTKNLGDKGFMILIGSINTVNFVLSFVTLYVLDKARNGAVIAVTKLIENIGLREIVVFLCVSLISGGIAVILALNIAKGFSVLISKINYKKTVISVILLIVFLVYFLTGRTGLFILIISTAVGLIPAIVKVTRTQAMGCIMVPVMLYFLV